MTINQSFSGITAGNMSQLTSDEIVSDEQGNFVSGVRTTLTYTNTSTEPVVTMKPIIKTT